MSAWVTLRELDRAAAQAKGTAFRAFKRAAPDWREEADFRVLDPARNQDEIESLRAAGRIYASTRSVVLLSPAFARALRSAIASPGSDE